VPIEKNGVATDRKGRKKEIDGGSQGGGGGGFPGAKEKKKRLLRVGSPVSRFLTRSTENCRFKRRARAERDVPSRAKTKGKSLQEVISHTAGEEISAPGKLNMRERRRKTGTKSR